ncbi:hypothetical protein GGR53DRAFT_222521 [Hypoxylon sp. FL1150]|nr:hypothetical protein GGR53DRAFT_222521 [Hypoxylon sp. FL1150]
MSVFSLIKRGRIQAKEHNVKKAEKAKDETVKLPYQHVVTHAALDALSGAPSSWKDTDRVRIMEQNRRKNALAASEGKLAGLPRVGSSLSYVSYASVHPTPIAPLPKNYSYSSIPASWREQWGGPLDGHDYFSQAKTSKGKEPEYLRPLPASVSRSSPTQTNAVSSKSVSPSGSSGNSNSSDEELEIRNKTANRQPENDSHQLKVSHKGSKETPNHTPLTSSRLNAEAPAKTDRHYPPPAQSTYFSAPRPLNRRALSSDTSVRPISTASGRPSSTASLYSSGNFSSALSIESIGLAIAPPMPPYAMARGPGRPAKEPDHAPELAHDKTTPISVTPSPALTQVSTEQRRTSRETIEAPLSGHSIGPLSAPAQRKRRRLSKSRPPSNDDSGIKMSIDTVRPDRPSTAVDSVTTIESSQVSRTAQQKGPSKITVTPVSESERRTTRRLSKNPKAKIDQKAPWPFRFGHKSPSVTAQ